MELTQTPSVRNNTDVSRLINAISSCCQEISDAFSTSFESVSDFASKTRSGIKQGWILVDIVVRNLILLQKHLTDLYEHIVFKKNTFVQEDIVPFLYQVEENLCRYMQTNQFFRHTFARVINGIIALVQHLRENMIVQPQSA